MQFQFVVFSEHFLKFEILNLSEFQTSKVDYNIPISLAYIQYVDFEFSFCIGCRTLEVWKYFMVGTHNNHWLLPFFQNCILDKATVSQ